MLLFLKKKNIFFIIVIAFILEGCMFYFDENGTYPLKLNIITVKEEGIIKFKVEESHIKLNNYYLNNIQVTTSNNCCAEEKYNKGETIWEYQAKLPQEKISVLSPIPYSGEALKKNTLYTVDVSINKVENSKIGRYGKGGGVFVITDKKEVLFGYDYDSINKLCKEY